MSPRYADILDAPILSLSAKDMLVFRSMVQGGVLSLGDSSSGKSSTSLKQLICGGMRAGLGMVCHTIKPEDTSTYIRYACENGREQDLIVFNEKSGLSMDCLAYEFSRTMGRGGGDVEAIVDFFDVLLSIGKTYSGGGDSRFWDLATQQAVRHSIHLIKLAGQQPSISNIHRAISSFPNRLDEHKDEGWVKESYAASLIAAIRERKESLTEEEWQNLEAASDFIFFRWAALDERPRSSIAMTFFGLSDKFNFNPLKRMFASGTYSFTPEQITHERKILIPDFPLNELGRETARMIQTMIKLTCQRAWLRHPYTPGCCNGAMLVQDEFQMLLHKQENYWAQTARSSGVASLYITQNLNNVAEEFGEAQPGSKTRAFLNNLGTKIAHRSTCPDTCTYLSDVIGKEYRYVENFSAGTTQDSGSSHNVGGSRQLTYILDPIEFTRLARPDGVNPLAAAIVYRGGDTFNVTQTEDNPQGTNYLKVHFTR